MFLKVGRFLWLLTSWCVKHRKTCSQGWMKKPQQKRCQLFGLRHGRRKETKDIKVSLNTEWWNTVFGLLGEQEERKGINKTLGLLVGDLFQRLRAKFKAKKGWKVFQIPKWCYQCTSNNNLQLNVNY